MQPKAQEPFDPKAITSVKKNPNKQKTQHKNDKLTKQSAPSLQSLLLSLCQELQKMNVPWKHVHNSLSFQNLRQSEYPRTGTFRYTHTTERKGHSFLHYDFLHTASYRINPVTANEPSRQHLTNRLYFNWNVHASLKWPITSPLTQFFFHNVSFISWKKGHKIINNYREQLRSSQAHSLGLSITWLKCTVSLKAIKL